MLAYKATTKTQHASRAYLPNEMPHPSYRHSVAQFSPEHDRTFTRLMSDLRTVGPKETETVPDRVVIGDYDQHAWRLTMSVCKLVRVLRDEDAAEIERLDHEVARLLEQRQTVLDESFRRGRPLHQRDIDPAWGEE